MKSALRKPVTAPYPEPGKELDIADRFMGFPALLWDGEVSEPYCTGCMVCIRACPTMCMTAEMKDNPLHAEGKSRRRKIIDTFEINLGRCILCRICVDVCNFDAIEKLEPWARDRGHSLLELAFAWLLAVPEVSSVIAGASNPEQLAQNAAACEWALTAEEKAEADGMLAI